MRRLVVVLGLCAVIAGCGGDKSPDKSKTVTIAINAPFSRTPYVGQTIADGAELAASKAAVEANGVKYRFRIKRYDTGLSPSAAVRNVRRAIADGAVAIVDEGTGVDASWQIARDGDIPLAVTYQGGDGLIDPDKRPNVFRIAPTDHGMSFRLAEYVIPKKLKVALITDDSSYGQQGAKALDEAFSQNPESVAVKLTVPTDSPDLFPQVLRARSAGATGLLVWAQPTTIAGVLSAARSSGWKVPVFTPPTGEDPLVRQQLANHPDWVDGLTFAAGRPTAEVGAGPFLSFQRDLENKFGVQLVGVKTSDGAQVVQPPDYAMYSYDFVNVLAAAIQRAGGVADREKVLAALNQVSVAGANGDQRGFNERNHEGVVDDDVYFAKFEDMIYKPVKDDPLSATLVPIEQRR
ncbi:MAG TPA: ABC transporter substrate-binding protein [Gaiellaceae bacterium]|nr:ABC transporter substrate-binding protein [Gaiellaceae bacterium]